MRIKLPVHGDCDGTRFRSQGIKLSQNRQMETALYKTRVFWCACFVCNSAQNLEF